MKEELSQRRTIHNFYGRTKTRPISQTKQKIMESVLDSFGIQSFEGATLSKYECVDLEIGFGDGTHLAQMAMQNQDRLFIGAEPFINGVASLAQKIHSNNITNIRIFNGNAHILLESIPKSSINAIYILFPDPWPKKRHHFRRIINTESLKKIHDVLTSNGVLRIASDHEDYCVWILNHLSNNNEPIFNVNIHENRPDQHDWPITKYERKAVTQITYITCHKLS